ncbi:hypothetical protein [Streptomyces sp. NPDC003077]|uniref:hypothetical protein n=1 Tax=Streptomyces sp. NPDC003077 TaxID=3154443 RepID=UPI0033A6A79C
MIEVLVGVAGTLAAAVIAAVTTLRARRPAGSYPELVEALILDPHEASNAPVLDLKLRNRGGETVVVKRLELDVLWARRFPVLDELLPYRDSSGAAMMEVSASYDVTLPEPVAAEGGRVVQPLSHALAAGDADRLQVRLNAPPTRAHHVRAALPAEVRVYLLRPRLVCNADDRSLTAAPVAVACPGNALHVPTPHVLRQRISRFETEVDILRQRIDAEMTAAGMAAPDWSGRPPRRADLPSRLTVFEESHRPLNDAFWRPREAIAGYLDCAEGICRDLVMALSDDALRGTDADGLDTCLPLAQETLDELPAIRRELRTTSRTARPGRADPMGAAGAS